MYQSNTQSSTPHCEASPTIPQGVCQDSPKTSFGTSLILILVAVTALFGPGLAWAQAPGDCNHDGVISILDALVAANHAASPSITGPRLLECDVNRSGDVDIVDALEIAQFVAGLRPPLQRIMCGDCADNDEMITNLDLGALINLQLNSQVVSSRDAACDANGNGWIDLDDRTAILNNPQCSSCGDCDQNGNVDSNDIVTLPFPLPAGSRAGRSCDVAPLTGFVSVADTAVLTAFLNGSPSVLNLCPGGISPTALPTVSSTPAGYCVDGSSNGTVWEATVTTLAVSGVVGPISVPPGGSATDLVAAWANAINNLPGLTASSAGNCFTAGDIFGLPASIAILSTVPQCTLPGIGTGGVCPFNPNLIDKVLSDDFDGDGIADGDEIANGSDPEDASSPGEDPQSRKPVAVDDFAVGAQGEAIEIDPAANDADPDHNLDQASLSWLEGPSSGEMFQNDSGSWTYQPNSDFIGTDSAHYRICDFDGLCDKGLVGIAVMPAPEEN